LDIRYSTLGVHQTKQHRNYKTIPEQGAKEHVQCSLVHKKRPAQRPASGLCNQGNPEVRSKVRRMSPPSWEHLSHPAPGQYGKSAQTLEEITLWATLCVSAKAVTVLEQMLV
jgi:hypothetical protein